MKYQKMLLVVVVAGLMAGTAGVLTWLRSNQKLGKPGIKATPIPGSVAMTLELPAQVLDFTSTNVPEPELVLGYLPKDTSFVERLYQAPDGMFVQATIILMGADRTSIHRPEMCLLGNGWQANEKTVVNIPIGGPHPYPLPVMKWVITRQQDGLRGLYVFWFVADNEMATHNVRLQIDLVRDLLFRGVLQRWAYMSYFAVCAPGQEEAAFERVKQLIAASVPEFQLPPQTAGAPEVAKQ